MSGGGRNQGHEEKDLPFDASKLVTSSRYSILHERYDKPSKRSALLLSHTPKHGLLLDIQFTPRFVEKAFWQWYYNTTLSVHARVALRLDVAIWLVCCCVVGVRSWYLLYTILCVFISAVVARIHDKHNAWYKKHARALTTLKRLLTFPNIKLMPSRGVQSPGMWQMVLVHIILRSGAIYNAIQPFYYTNYWLLSAALSAVAAFLFSSSATAACQDLLAAQQPAAAIVLQRLAAALDAAVGGVFHDSIQRQDMALASCTATAQTIHVVVACMSLCGLYAFELRQRIRYKQTLPGPVAAMQHRIYMSKWPLRTGQVLLLILYPILVISWLAIGLHHGLTPGFAVDNSSGAGDGAQR